MTTAIVYAPEYLEHDTGRHPECASRVSGIKTRLETCANVAWISPREATEAEILACHTPDHLELVLGACEAAKTRRVGLDLDTPVSVGSLTAAKLGAGGGPTAIDAVMSGAASNAFLLVRPPGHHATPDRAMGFCLFNNAAVAARYVRNTYNLDRVLIVDWDVHHGNGTQDVFYSDPSVFYYSIHQFPHYPGTGARSEIGAGAGQNYTLNVPLPGHTKAADHIAAFRHGLDEVVSRFKPEFIVISAGFDAHVDDPLGDMLLTDEDFADMTLQVKRIAEEYCDGRLVSMLEGGYNLSALPGTVKRHVEVLAEK